MSAFRAWLIRKLGGVVKTCDHKWRILIEHYPSFTKDYWECTRCNIAKVFPNGDPPVPLQTEICSLGDVHIVNGMKLPSAQASGRKRARGTTKSRRKSV